MANGVTTEWEDILVKKGIWNARPQETPQTELNLLAQERVAGIFSKSEYNFAKQLQDEDVDALEDELEEEFMKEFKQKRMQEIMEQQMKPKFGSLVEISRDEYIKEVTEASNGTFVILHLYQNYIEKCNLINQHMNTLAKEYTDIKFTKILSTRCIENFPDSNLPCVIIYKNGELFKNIPNFDKLNLTQDLTKKAMIKVLMKLEVIKLEEIDSEDEELTNLQKYTRGKIGFGKNREQDISDDEHDDRGFSYNRL